MDEKLRQAYYYDFYGELLNERQRRFYEDYTMNDLSLGEIAEAEGISRQAVADMVHRCDRKLAAYESKLHLVERFLAVKRSVEQIKLLAADFSTSRDPQLLDRIETISNEILEEL